MQDKFSIAEGAFVRAVRDLLIYQNEIEPVVKKLHDLEDAAARANTAALNDSGLTDDDPLPAIVAVQKRMLTAAMEASELPEQSNVLRGVRAQIREMEEVFNQMEAARSAELEGIRGPEL